jgi:hypothetical protein
MVLELIWPWRWARIASTGLPGISRGMKKSTVIAASAVIR